MPPHRPLVLGPNSYTKHREALKFVSCNCGGLCNLAKSVRDRCAHNAMLRDGLVRRDTMSKNDNLLKNGVGAPVCRRWSSCVVRKLAHCDTTSKKRYFAKEWGWRVSVPTTSVVGCCASRTGQRVVRKLARRDTTSKNDNLLKNGIGVSVCRWSCVAHRPACCAQVGASRHHEQK